MTGSKIPPTPPQTPARSVTGMQGSQPPSTLAQPPSTLAQPPPTVVQGSQPPSTLVQGQPTYDVPVGNLMTKVWNDSSITDRKKLFTVIRSKMERAPLNEKNDYWPSHAIAQREKMAGVYPDPSDPQFPARLYEKREFYEARALIANVAEGNIDPCSSLAAESLFELTPIQRVVSRFLHPMTPYMGLLLYHGVGVGKTCSAVTIAEQYLDLAKGSSQVIVLVPQALKINFLLTVFDPAKLVWDAVTKQWTARQCTGVSYLERIGLLEKPDLQYVTRKVEDDIKTRYTVKGYQSFANGILRTLQESIPQGLTDERSREMAENELLRKMFSDKLIIIDEAHNLRDLSEHGSNATETGGTTAKTVVHDDTRENQGGKTLNPLLKRIVLCAEGTRVVLMTATPMYNSAPEIVQLLNYLIMNDTKHDTSIIKINKLFSKDGVLLPGEEQRKLEMTARAYISYMRGENPYTFPLRIKSADSIENSSTMWLKNSIFSATKQPIVLSDKEKHALDAMPLVFTEPVVGSPVDIQLRSASLRFEDSVGIEEGGTDAMLDVRMQMANITYGVNFFGTNGFDKSFITKQITSTAGHSLHVFNPASDFDIDSVFTNETLIHYAPKIYKIVNRLITAKGICFVYSRYIKSGALPLAIALERAGFQRRLADGRIESLLTGVSAVTPICAICGIKQTEHEHTGTRNRGVTLGRETAKTGVNTHPFYPACYVLLTSSVEVSPNFEGLVKQAITITNDVYGPVGSNVKVVIGSQIASEGLDLKCIREMHILDSWYHLNRTDQIIGRAIRYCSHTALRSIEKANGYQLMSMNNCSVYLHVAYLPQTTTTYAIETADMYAYRIAITKSLNVGTVQRILKKHAWDCNLELDAITFTGLPRRNIIDSQNEIHESYDINDRNYTSYCDYQECNHSCAITVDKPEIDSSTFGKHDARRIIVMKQELVRNLFNEQVIVPIQIIKSIFEDLPWEIASEALMELIDGKRFQFTRPDGVVGYLVIKNGYVVFQPSLITNTNIPLTLRYAKGFQLIRQHMDTSFSEMPDHTVSAAGDGEDGYKKAEDGDSIGTLGPPAIMQDWIKWIQFVNNDADAVIPPDVPVLWTWILTRFASIPQIKEIAYRWWFDKIPTIDQQKQMLDYMLLHNIDTNDIYLQTLSLIYKHDIYITQKLQSYRIYNPMLKIIEYVCIANTTNTITACNTLVSSLIDKHLGNRAIEIQNETGTLVGFLSSRHNDDKLVFKTLDTTKQKTTSTIGAECGNVSNMNEHFPRVKLLHAAGNTMGVLKELMLPDSHESWIADGSRQRLISLNPTHLKDFTHQPICMYMEFLTRLLDKCNVNNKRWFFSAIEAYNSGLRGKAIKAIKATKATDATLA